MQYHICSAAVCAVMALTANASNAQESRIVSLFELYHTDNAFGGTSGVVRNFATSSVGNHSLNDTFTGMLCRGVSHKDTFGQDVSA